MRHQSWLVSCGREKGLRSNPTLAEKRLWSGLRALSFKFRRPRRLGRRIVDYYGPEARLAVEVDGTVHSGEAATLRDRERDEEIRALGVEIIHFRNEQVFGNINEVLEQIEEICLFL